MNDRPEVVVLCEGEEWGIDGAEPDIESGKIQVVADG